jgi:hypothetical protein
MPTSTNIPNLPKAYRRYARPPEDDTVSVASSLSWRTFDTLTAPSEVLSFQLGAVGSLTGRVLNKLGEMVLAPIENRIIQRELEQMREYLDEVSSPEEWSEVRVMMNDERALDRILEPLRLVEPSRCLDDIS